MTERESIISMMSGPELELFLATGGVIPARSMRRIRKRFANFLAGVSDADLSKLDWTLAEEEPTEPVMTAMDKVA